MWTEALKHEYVKKNLKQKYTSENKSKDKRNTIRVSGLVHAHAWTTLRAHNQACVPKQDYAHVGFRIETLET